MAKILNLRSLTSFLITILTFSSSTRIQCKFEIDRFYYLGERYRCNIITDPIINFHESAQITAVYGDHEDYKSDKDVLGLFTESSTIEYFPRNAEKFFNNLEAIHLNFCPLKEIFQSDLKSLTKLTYLFIANSHIEVIEDGLFDYNPNLQYLIFDAAKIIHIDPNVFDNLSQLKLLNFYMLSCSAQLRSEYDFEIKLSIQKFKANCVSSEYLELSQHLDVLKDQSLALDVENFNKKLEIFELRFNVSKFSKFRPLKNKYESLKNDGLVKKQKKFLILIFVVLLLKV